MLEAVQSRLLPYCQGRKVKITPLVAEYPIKGNKGTFNVYLGVFKAALLRAYHHSAAGL